MLRSSGPRQALGSLKANRVFAIRLARTITLSLCLSELLLTNLFFELFLEQPQQTNFEIRFKVSVPIEMFVTWISFRGTFQSFWDLTEVSAQSWYKVRTYDLVHPTFKISLLPKRQSFGNPQFLLGGFLQLLLGKSTTSF